MAGDRKLDVTAALVIAGWSEIREEYGDWRGKPPNGLRRPVPHYSRDAGRALHLARKASAITGGSIIFEVTEHGILVEAEDAPPIHKTVASRRITRTHDVAKTITEVAVVLVQRQLKQQTAG